MFDVLTVYATGADAGAGAAADAAGTAAAGGPMALIGTFIPLILMIAVFYFILIRPQDKQLKEMIAALKVGDEVATIGGIHGKIFRIKDDTFVLESGVGVNKSYIQVDRSAVSRLTKEADTNSKKATPIFDEEGEIVDNEPDTAAEENSK